MDKKIKIIFAGTANIATPLLRALSEDSRFDVCLVITQMDKPAGRKMELTHSPVKREALGLSLKIFQPENINSLESIGIISAEKPDAIIVMAYGQIFSAKVLAIPSHGCLNIHASLLPQYRGASPIQSALLNGDKETGVSLMRMAEHMDTGPVYAQFKIAMKNTDNSIELSEKLSHLTAQKIPSALYEAINGISKPIDQNEKNATYSIKISKTDGNIDWSESAEKINRKIRAFAGWPSAYTYFSGKLLKILSAEVKTASAKAETGTVFKENGETMISAGSGAISPMIVQMEGKKPQQVKDFINGNPDFINSKLTSKP